jgi:hypothetical protein
MTSLKTTTHTAATSINTYAFRDGLNGPLKARIALRDYDDRGRTVYVDFDPSKIDALIEQLQQARETFVKNDSAELLVHPLIRARGAN